MTLITDVFSDIRDLRIFRYTADQKYSHFNRHNLTQPTQMELSLKGRRAQTLLNSKPQHL